MNFSGNLWTSASDVGRRPGEFLWADGRKVEQAMWASRQPDSFGEGKEACAVLASDFLLWDYDCSQDGKYFVCKMDPECK